MFVLLVMSMHDSCSWMVELHISGVVNQGYAYPWGYFGRTQGVHGSSMEKLPALPVLLVGQPPRDSPLLVPLPGVHKLKKVENS